MDGWFLAQWIMLGVSLALFVFFARYRSQSVFQKAYVLVSLFGFIWALGQHIENTLLLYYPHNAYYYAALLVCYLGMCMLGPSCVYLAWCYSGKFRLYRSAKTVALLFAAGIAFYVIILTNDVHHTYYTSFTIGGRTYGMFFYLFTAFSYVCFGYAYITMQQARWDAGGRSPMLLLFCFLPPILANTVGMIVKNVLLDFTPLAYLLMHIGTLLNVFLYRPYNLTPVAAKKVIDDLAYPIWIADGASMLYANKQASVLASLPDMTVERCEIGGQVYSPKQKKLDDGNHIFSLTDITPFDRALRETEEQNNQLSRTRDALRRQAEILEQYSSAANALAAERKRTEIMTRLDGEVRHMLSALKRNIEACIETPDEKGISEGMKLSAKTLDMVRQIIGEFR